MGRYNLSSRAKQDLLELRRYIARDSPRDADRVVREIRAKMRELADHPGQGHKREDLTDQPLSFWPVYTYLIIYRPETSPLEVIAIPSGFENVADLLNADVDVDDQ